MATTPVGSSSTDTTAATTAALNNGLGSLKLDDFLKMLLTELQNQDPLSPMDSSTMLTQIGQISQVGSTQQLTSTLNSVLLGQNLNNATSLIGKTIDGLADDQTEVTGKVDKVTVANGKPILTVGDKTVQLENVRAVLPDSATAADAATAAASQTDQASQLLKLLQQLQQSQPTQATSVPATTPVAATT
jgi:flagellar basal-body rod modification protein FlgD